VASPFQQQPGASASGFQARIQGASLWDLVQIECQARARRSVRVATRDGVGYLYFADGRIVHAQTQRATGERAALEILQWSDGSFESWERSWPGVPSIHQSYEALLLHAAKLRDEGAVSNLVTFPAAPPPPADDGELEIEMVEAEAPARRAQQEDAMESTTAADASNDFPVILRLSPSGAVLKNKGASEDMAAAIAYAARLLELTGELLGAGRFMAMECTVDEGRWLLFSETDGDTVALRPRVEANLGALRAKLGL
jgi:hypothetical protein